MPLHLPSLLFAGALSTALAALVMTLFGLSQKVYRGYALWAAAQWLAGAALALQWVGHGNPALQATSLLLLLQAPLLLLLGTRRFQARQPLRGSAGLDLLLFAFIAIGCIGAQFADSATVRGALGGLGFGAACAYAAFVLLAAPPAEGTTLRLLGAGMGAAAVIGLLGGLRTLDFAPTDVAAAGGDLQPALALAVALQAAVTTYLTLLLTHQRTERQLRESHHRLRFFAHADLLAPVPDGRLFAELAKRALRRAPQRKTALLTFDLDSASGALGAAGGSSADGHLKLVSQCVHGTLRAHDLAGRRGAGVFVLLLPGTSLRNAMAVATRIVARAHGLALAQEMPQVSINFGVVELRAQESLDDAMQRADLALFEAKRQGRGRAVSASVDKERPVFVESRRIGLAPL